MSFDCRSWWLAKDADHPNEYEDAFAADGRRGIAAIADGVASAIFSRRWADLLTRSLVNGPPPMDDPDGFRNWLADVRGQWLKTIDLARLTWPQRMKLQQVGGAYSTLLWVELAPSGGDADAAPADADGPAASFHYRAVALGDCGLFHFRDGNLVCTFPMERSADFDTDPPSLCSVDQRRDHLLEFQAIEGECLPGDLLILGTDAVAKWVFQRLELGQIVPWDAFWDQSAEAWSARVSAMRGDDGMRFDDTTLAILKVGAVPAEPAIESEQFRESSPEELTALSAAACGSTSTDAAGDATAEHEPAAEETPSAKYSADPVTSDAQAALCDDPAEPAAIDQAAAESTAAAGANSPESN